MPVFVDAGLSLGALNLVLVGVVIGRRIFSAVVERRASEADRVLRPLVVAFLAGDAAQPPLLDAPRRALGELLARYGRLVQGDARDRVAALAAETGLAETLRRRLRARRPWRRSGAARRLGDLGMTSAVPELLALLDDRVRDVRQAVATSLGQLRAAQAVGRLLGSLTDGRIPASCVRWALVEIGSDALPGLRATAGYRDPAVRAMAVQLVSRLGDPSDGPWLEAALGDADPRVRVAAARGLGRLGGAPAADALRARLEDSDDAVRAAVAGSLGRLGVASALDALLSLAVDGPFDVAAAAARAAVAIDPVAARRAALDAAALDDGGASANVALHGRAVHLEEATWRPTP